MKSILTFFAIQLDRIRARPVPHSSGPKKPSLSDLDTGKNA